MRLSAKTPDIEIFGLKVDDGRYYLYAPLEHGVAVVNAAAVAAVNHFLHQGESCLTPAERAVISQLQEAGIISSEPAQRPVAPADYLF